MADDQAQMVGSGLPSMEKGDGNIDVHPDPPTEKLDSADKEIAVVPSQSNGENRRSLGANLSNANLRKLEPVKEKKEPSKRVQEGQRWNNRFSQDPKAHYRKAHVKNVKTDFTAQEESKDPVAIRKQVEFYFSDSNLLQDQFLFNKINGHENLPIDIDVIHSFKRMRHFQPRSAVIEALKGSQKLNLVEGEKATIQRKVPLPETVKGKSMIEVMKAAEDEAMKKTVYVKGFGQEKPTTQFDIEAFFAEFGPTSSVRLRRYDNRMFKGSVFVEFDTEEAQKAFLELDPQPKWKGEDLIIKSKEQHSKEQNEKTKTRRTKSRQNTNHAGNRGPRGRNADDNRDWRKRREEDAKQGFPDHKGGKPGGGRSGHQKHDNDKESREALSKKRTHEDESSDLAAELESSSKKRIREDNDAEDESLAGAGVKDVPTRDDEKTEKPSKKRARDEDEDEEAVGQAAKKADIKTVE
ncbi:MAG: hypothetical protein LQ351_001615 [Letrouitia transgressa]|nr:MAG: hypothetical protein LQ351_001615 [Letrouitia transgressa]